MDELICRECKQSKPVNEFFKATKKIYYDKLCRSCKHIQQQARRKEFKEFCVAHKGGKCERCGYDKCLAALQFHHIDPTQKDFEISHHGLMTREKAIEEMKKCILLCANCHKEKHAGIW